VSKNVNANGHGYLGQTRLYGPLSTLSQSHLKMHGVSMYENCNDLLPRQEWVVATSDQLVI
jgi:hypothetical protein